MLQTWTRHALPAAIVLPKLRESSFSEPTLVDPSEGGDDTVGNPRRSRTSHLARPLVEVRPAAPCRADTANDTLHLRVRATRRSTAICIHVSTYIYIYIYIHVYVHGSIYRPIGGSIRPQTEMLARLGWGDRPISELLHLLRRPLLWVLHAFEDAGVLLAQRLLR